MFSIVLTLAPTLYFRTKSVIHERRPRCTCTMTCGLFLRQAGNYSSLSGLFFLSPLFSLTVFSRSHSLKLLPAPASIVYDQARRRSKRSQVIIVIVQELPIPATCFLSIMYLPLPPSKTITVVVPVAVPAGRRFDSSRTPPPDRITGAPHN